jgi:hypothetical protein
MPNVAALPALEFKGIDAIVIVLPLGLIFGFCYWR